MQTIDIEAFIKSSSLFHPHSSLSPLPCLLFRLPSSIIPHPSSLIPLPFSRPGGMREAIEYGQPLLRAQLCESNSQKLQPSGRTFREEPAVA